MKIRVSKYVEINGQRIEYSADAEFPDPVGSLTHGFIQGVIRAMLAGFVKQYDFSAGLVEHEKE